jgi:two-component system sensor histidine kinase BaeS
LAQADVGALKYEKRPSDVWAVLQDVVLAFAERFRAAGLTVSVGPAPSRAVVSCDVDRVRQVAVNVLENCVRYTKPGGRVELNGAAVDDALHLTFDDSAPGVPEPALARLGERFYRVGASRSRASGGAGLGLALCRHIVEAHGGQMEFSPSPLGGLRVTVTLAWA